MHLLSLISSNGNTLCVHASGNGATLILLHGFPLDHRMWSPLMESLSPFYHCVAIDFRGFGGSTLDGGYSLVDLADDVEFVRQHLAPDQQIHLAGLSMGGYVAMEYWQRHGQHLKSLTLANTRPSGDDPAGQRARYDMARSALEASAWQAVSPMLSRLIAPDSVGTAAENSARQMMRSANASAIAEAQKAMAARRDFSQLIELCNIPTLVITGQFDPMTTPQATRQWAERLPNGAYQEIAGAGHLTPLEKPIEFQRALIDFIKNL